MTCSQVPGHKPQSSVSKEDIKYAAIDEEKVPYGCAVRILLGISNKDKC
jgi:hypothetical protein